MRHLFGLIMVGGLLGSASVANAQLSISVGNPYGAYGGGYYGSPYVAGYGSTLGYGGYSSYAYPGTTFYSSGYSGYVYPSVVPSYVAPVYSAPVYSYGYAPSYGYVSTYRYGPAYGYGYRRGIPGFNRNFGRFGLPF